MPTGLTEDLMRIISAVKRKNRNYRIGILANLTTMLYFVINKLTAGSLPHTAEAPSLPWVNRH